MEHLHWLVAAVRQHCYRIVIAFLAMAVSFPAHAGGAGFRRATGPRVSPAELPISTPEAQGVDSERLAAGVDFLIEQRERYDVHSVTVVRHGHVVADVSFYPYRSDSLHSLASVSKVFLTTLVGIAIEEGYIRSVHERVIDFFPDRQIANLDERKRAMTIEDLLTMTSGLGTIDELDTARMERSLDWTQFALDLPMSHYPGTHWKYHQPTAVLLSAVLTQATGMTAYEFARSRLFEPLGVLASHWTATPEGISRGYCGLKLVPGDLAKFGQLVLQGGLWEGNQLIPEQWVETATAGVVGGVYGFMWFQHPQLPGCILAAGLRGQFLVIVPDSDLVVVLTGGGFSDEDIRSVFVEFMQAHLLPAVRSAGSMASNPDGAVALKSASRRAGGRRSDPQPVPPLPGIASFVAGTTFDVQPNFFGIQSVTLRFPDSDEGRLRFVTDGRVTFDTHFQWAAGLDGVERCARGMLRSLECGTGRWLNDRTFEMDVDLLGLLARYRLTLDFSADGERMAMTFEDLNWWETSPSFVLSATKSD